MTSVELFYRGTLHRVTLERSGDRTTATVGDRAFDVEIVREEESRLTLRIDGATRSFHLLRTGGRIEIASRGARGSFEASGAPAARVRSAEAPSDGRVATPMPGKVVVVHVREGDEVEAGQPLVVLESMKMQSDVVAPMAGTVRAVRCEAGTSVEFGDLLVELEVPSAGESPVMEPKKSRAKRTGRR